MVAKRRLGKVDDPEALAVLEACYERVVAVMNEEVSSFQAPMVLRAAAAIADGVAGPQASRIQVDGRMTLEHLVMRSYEEQKALPGDSEARPSLPRDEPLPRALVQ